MQKLHKARDLELALFDRKLKKAKETKDRNVKLIQETDNEIAHFMFTLCSKTR